MTMLLGLLALVCAAIFLGAAFYINVAEQPARMMLPEEPLLRQWAPSYKRGFAMQSVLAILGFLLGTAAWWTNGNALFLAGAILMIANWPWTLIAIFPTNNTLLSIDPSSSDRRIRPLLEKWNRLHAVRTALSAAAVSCFVAALS
jgi:uncharacterized membrane protein